LQSDRLSNAAARPRDDCDSWHHFISKKG